ncbi:microsomal signal peptidase 12 kDa subunit [Meira miltonrushii]|uniref:Signal peptidase complex subunit 1 n=1 Tax=Meira miltonrushii TaxID=1280837 RepID=A0A316VDC2_9BASI|nr:microsomal signal peptidase 12 kDa subunit [Meira miltonrushii]PWN35324.1 microsomal signal peptidase 12 kDa subunit [Meira miltonrushii]
MDAIRQAVEGKIPFQGQRLADRINQEVIVMGAIVAWIIGYFADNLFLCMSVFGFSCFVALVVAVPPWPMYHRNPVIWLPNRPRSEDSKSK